MAGGGEPVLGELAKSRVTVSLTDADPRRGYERLTLGKQVAGEYWNALVRLWGRFIERTGGVYTVEALYVNWFANGYGTQGEWEHFATPYIAAGIEACIDAVLAGIDVDDITAGA